MEVAKDPQHKTTERASELKPSSDSYSGLSLPGSELKSKQELVAQITTAPNSGVETKEKPTFLFQTKDGAVNSFEVKAFSKDHPIGYDFVPDEKLGTWMAPSKNSRKEDVVTGGSNVEPSKIMTHFGLCLEKTSQEDIVKLLDAHKDNITFNAYTQKNFEEVLKDKYVFTGYKQFLEDGGKLDSKDAAMYSPATKKSPLTISIGEFEKNEPVKLSLSLQSTLRHELLHYLSDKNDSRPSENLWRMGAADHYFVYPITKKIEILETMRRGGEPPMLESREPDAERLNKTIRKLSQGQLDELHAFVSAPKFYTDFVKTSMAEDSQMLPGLWKNEAKKAHFLQEREGFYMTNNTELREISHLYAQHAALTQAGYRIGIAVAKENSIALDEAFKHPKFQAGIEAFVAKLSETQAKEPAGSLYMQAKKIIDEIIRK